MANTDRIERSRTRHSRDDDADHPMIGEVVHFYELRQGEVYGPLAAMVTALAGRHSREANLAVIGEASIRFVPLVPRDDAARESGMWWARAEHVDPKRVKQNGL
jgi:hypothetical protein